MLSNINKFFTNRVSTFSTLTQWCTTHIYTHRYDCVVGDEGYDNNDNKTCIKAKQNIFCITITYCLLVCLADIQHMRLVVFYIRFIVYIYFSVAIKWIPKTIRGKSTSGIVRNFIISRVYIQWVLPEINRKLKLLSHIIII